MRSESRATEVIPIESLRTGKVSSQSDLTAEILVGLRPAGEGDKN
jgi:hypothetical protein